MSDRAPPPPRGPSPHRPALRLVNDAVDPTPPASPRRDTTAPTGRTALPTATPTTSRSAARDASHADRIPRDPRPFRAPDPSDAPGPAERLRRRQAAARIAAENQSSAGLDPRDVRWAFAARVAESLDGGRTAILAPERRRRLVRLATSLGLREFDANLIIAVVQDGARTGEGALSRSVEHRLEMVRPPATDRARPSLAWTLMATLLAAGLMLLWLVQWVTTP